MDCIKDLQDAIRNILVNNGLTELCLGEPDELNDLTYIIWYDRQCGPHEDPVLKVYLENEGIAVAASGSCSARSAPRYWETVLEIIG